MRNSLSILAILVFGLCACTIREPSSPSIFIIAVDSLAGTDVNCLGDNDEVKGGFDTFCQESVRFTHAFTPSVMVQSAMASLLTGKLPMEHGIRHNGMQYLNPETNTLAELALQRGYKTAFHNSGFSIKRFSRLHQGFEFYDDAIPIYESTFSLSVDQVFEKAINWLDEEAGARPVFQVSVLSDLLTPWNTTRNDLGETRAQGYAGQLEELDESLGTFIKNLKNRKLWDKSYVILVGLNGRPNLVRREELPGSDLHSENVQVAMFFKPPKGREEMARNWKFDGLVSLADIGVSVKAIFGLPHEPEKPWSPVSLLSVIDEAPGMRLDPNRVILIESGWPQMVGLANIRSSIRRGHNFLVLDKKVKSFNTLIDRTETVATTTDRLDKVPWLQDIYPQLQEIGLEPWEGIDSNLVSDLDFIYKGRSQQLSPEESFFSQLLERNKSQQSSIVLKSFTEELILRGKKWRLFAELNEKWKDANITSFLAAMEQGESSLIDSPCWLALIAETSTFPNKELCDEPGFMEFYSIKKTEAAVGSETFIRFINFYNYFKLTQNFEIFDISTGGMVSGNYYLRHAPTIIDYALGLPQFKKISQHLERQRPNLYLEIE